MKLLRAKTHGPIQIKGVELPWEDVWVTFTAKPNRKKVRMGPTLIGRADVEGELEMEKGLMAEHKDWDDVDLKRYERILKTFETQHIVVDDERSPNCPCVYINKRLIDKKDAELMLDAMMKHYGYTGARVKWRRTKAKATYIIPMSFYS